MWVVLSTWMWDLSEYWKLEVLTWLLRAPGSGRAEPCPCHRDQTVWLFLVRTLASPHSKHALDPPLLLLHVTSPGPPVSRICDTGHVTGLIIIWAPVTSVTSLCQWPCAECWVTRDAGPSNYQFSIYPMQPKLESFQPSHSVAPPSAQCTWSVLCLLLKNNDHFPW